MNLLRLIAASPKLSSEAKTFISYAENLSRGKAQGIVRWNFILQLNMPYPSALPR